MVHRHGLGGLADRMPRPPDRAGNGWTRRDYRSSQPHRDRIFGIADGDPLHYPHCNNHAFPNANGDAYPEAFTDGNAIP